MTAPANDAQAAGDQTGVPAQVPTPAPAQAAVPAPAATGGGAGEKAPAEPARTTAAEPAPATLPAAAAGAVARPAERAPAHRGAQSKPYNDILHRTLKPSVRWLINRVLMRVSLEGVEHVPSGEPLIFAGNHTSWLDGPLVVIESPRTVRCLTKIEMFRGIVGWLLRLVGQIPIDRGKADRTALHTALDELARGNAIGVFPEGTRGSGEMAAVQHGIAYLAVHGRARVVPVACLGTGDAMPKGARWPRRSVPVRVVFGEPFAVEIPANPRSRKALAQVAEDIRVRLADHLAAARASGPGGTTAG